MCLFSDGYDGSGIATACAGRDGVRTKTYNYDTPGKLAGEATSILRLQCRSMRVSGPVTAPKRLRPLGFGLVMDANQGAKQAWRSRAEAVRIAAELIIAVRAGRHPMTIVQKCFRRGVLSISSPWLIAVTLSIGWGPLFVAECIRGAFPALDRAFEPQHFAMYWVRSTLLFSVLAALIMLAHGIAFVVRLSRRSLLYTGKRSEIK